MVTMERVNNTISASFPTPSAEPEPRSPRPISRNTGVVPNSFCIRRGAAAPSRESTSAPPIQSRNGPSTLKIPFRTELVMKPLSQLSVSRPSLTKLSI